MHTKHGLHHEMLRVGGVRFEVQVMLQPPTLPHFSSLRVSFWLCSIPAPPRLHYSCFPAPFEFLPYYFPVPFWLRSNFISTQVLLGAEQGQMVIFQRVGHASSSSSCVTQGPPVPAVGVQQVDCSVLCLGSMRACSSIRFPLLLIPNLWIP